jgi:hypothetical protein
MVEGHGQFFLLSFNSFVFQIQTAEWCAYKVLNVSDISNSDLLLWTTMKVNMKHAELIVYVWALDKLMIETSPQFNVT